MRHAIASARFYTDDKDELNMQLAGLFSNAKHLNEENKNVIGFISPHAGYFFSGKAAAKAYSYIKTGNYDVFVILGVDHTGMAMQRIAVSLDSWETPLGIVETDKDLAERIIKQSSAVHNEDAHKYEHSIEVQLPFLQFLFKEKAKIIAITVGKYDNSFGEQLYNIIKDSGKKACFIASSDFTHYGIGYGFTPFNNIGNMENIKEKTKSLDFGAIKHIENFDSNGFLEYTERTKATICGLNTIPVLIDIAKEVQKDTGKKVKAEVVEYYMSSDIIRDGDNSVSYAGIVFYTY